MTIQALVLADDPSIRDWLSDTLGGRVGVLPADNTDADGFAEEVAQTPGVGLVFVEFGEDNASDRAAVLSRVAERHPSLVMAAVGERESADAVLAAMRAGARDFLVARRDDGNLDALVDKVEQRGSSRAASRGTTGRLYSVVAGSPNVGVSFLAVHLALGLQMRGDDERRVLLVDLTVPGGSSLIFLDTEQSYNALDALRDVERCDQTLIDTAFTRYRDGIYLLSLPEEAVGPPHVDDEDLGRLLESFALYFDYVVVAANNGIGLKSVASVVASAQRSLLVTDQTVLTGRQNKHLLHALRQSDTPLDSTGLVIDQYQPRLGLTPERLAELLDLPHLSSLSGNERARLEAMNAGETLFDHAARDQYCRDVDALIRELTGEAAPEAKPGGWFSRWFR